MRLFLFLACALAGAAHGAHPLNTEDTDTQGRGGWQVELNGERNKDEGVRGWQAAGLLSYGLLENVDLQAGLPWQDNGLEKGVGDAIAAVKWRFWAREPWSFGATGETRTSSTTGSRSAKCRARCSTRRPRT